jgi:signal transduction histidine kinase
MSDREFAKTQIENQPLERYLESERVRTAKYRFVAVNLYLGIPLWLVCWIEDLVYVPSLKWELLSVRLAVVLMLIVGIFGIKKAGTSITLVQSICCSIVAFNSIGLTYVIKASGGLQSIYWASINLGPVATVAMIPWTGGVLYFALIMNYLPFYLECADWSIPLYMQNELIVCSFFNGATSLMVVVIQRITDNLREKECILRFQLNSEIEKRNSIIEKKTAEAVGLRLSASLGQLAFQVAHDIRSPLAALRVLSNLLTEIREEEKSLLKHSVQRITEIANELLQNSRKTEHITKIMPHDYKNNLQSVQVFPLIEQVLIEHRYKLKRPSAVQIVDVFYPGYLSFCIFADPIHFKRVFSILLDNAVESLTNNAELVGRVDVVLKKVDSDIIVEIRDTGKGIPKHLIDKLGTEKMTFGKENGSGLGLLYAKSKITEWNGSLFLSSDLSQGTVVKVILKSQ